MTPEVQAKYDETHRYWESIVRHPTKSIKVGLPEPLKFEIPDGVEPSLGNRPNIGDGVMNEHRAYFEARGGKRKLLEFTWLMAAGFIVIFIVMTLIQPRATFLGIENWHWLIICIITVIVLRPLTRRMTRRGCHVFDRDTGKIYLCVGDKLDHLELDFYEQYFYANSGVAGWSQYGTLSLKPRVRKPNGEFKTLPTLRIASGGSKDDGLGAWYCLVRYMDRGLPFTQDEFDLFEFLIKRQQKLGFKVEGLPKADGTTEWL